jgi:hypothetical protein
MKPTSLSFPNTASVWFFLQSIDTKKVQVQGTVVTGKFSAEEIELARKHFQATIHNKTKWVVLSFSTGSKPLVLFFLVVNLAQYSAEFFF